MKEPKRLKITQDGQILAYGVEFDGGRLYIQVTDGIEFGMPHPYPQMERLLAVLRVDESAVEWLDE